ncbi:hypothetical protein [Streptomyces sp. NBC_00893]|uniref:hypothetical protein n=1 Tax=Streptomyces sp. NBC_00893 TaxID=2975862 RepID=UPI00224CD004|nr:hypothetical protein [Streptomyces sp. NBC_00893]MCX4852092.1 hypothetical protein [Streptomyces sp. NBC_00893]
MTVVFAWCGGRFAADRYDAATKAAGRKDGDPQRAEWLEESAAYVAAAQALAAAAGIAQ